MNSQEFLDLLSDFKQDYQRVSDKQNLLLEKKYFFDQQLKKTLYEELDINQSSSLAKAVEEVRKTINKGMDNWNKKLEDSQPMKRLSEQYADRIILLVFGKVNAGKSSFSNFIADFFPNDKIRRFAVNNGQIEYFSENKAFAEGVVETTAAIQGIELGDKLVLLDSPGLHSVTDQNGELTRRFTDSADAILWLSPSTSPGQVQELQDLKVELEKNKPLQPIITRSDEIEEDFCEKTHRILQTLKNKSMERRAMQEEDVIKRLKQSNIRVPVKDAISISIHAYKNSQKSVSDLEDAGLNKLFDRLFAIIKDAKVYKVNKANQQILNFIDLEVLETLNNLVKPTLNKLTKESEQTTTLIERKKEYLLSQITASVLAEIPLIVNRHKNSRNKELISNEINQLIEKKINIELYRQLAGFVKSIGKVSSTLSKESLGDFEAITIEIEQVSGSGYKSAVSSAGMVAGALFGSFIPGLGTMVGSTLGGMLGGLISSKLGDNLITREKITEEVGISANALITKTTEQVKNDLPIMINAVCDDILKIINSVNRFANKILEEIDSFEKEIEKVRG